MELEKWCPSPYEPPGERERLLRELATLRRRRVELEERLASNKPLPMQLEASRRATIAAAEEANRRRRVEAFNLRQRCRREAEKKTEIEEERRKRHRRRWRSITDSAEKRAEEESKLKDRLADLVTFYSLAGRR